MSQPSREATAPAQQIAQAGILSISPETSRTLTELRVSCSALYILETLRKALACPASTN